MQKTIHSILTASLVFCLAANAQQTRQSTNKKQNAYAALQAEVALLPPEEQQLALQYLKGMNEADKRKPTLGNLSNAQKAHLNVYARRKAAIRSGKYSQKEWFEPLFQSTANYAANLKNYIFTQQETLRKQLETLQSTQKSNMPPSQQVLQLQRLLALYDQSLEICLQISDAYKKKKTSGMKNAIERLTLQECLFFSIGSRLPKREWLTETEALPLLSVLEARSTQQHIKK